MSADLLVAFAPAVGGAGLAVTVISYVRWLCKREDAREPLDNETRHLNHELVDVRSSVFKANELVATLCVTCDKQFPPSLWEAKISAELDTLDGKNAGVVRRQHSLGELEKLGFTRVAQSKVPGSMNILVHFKCRSNADHTVQLILHDKAHAKRFREYKGFGGEWKGELEHNSACHGHRATPYVPVQPDPVALHSAVTREAERIRERIGQAYGGELVGPDPEPTSSWTYARFRQYGWQITEAPRAFGELGPSGEHDLMHVVLAKGNQRFMMPMTRRRYHEWFRR